MNPHRAYNLANQLLETHGLSDWSVTFNRRKKVLGLCRADQKRIELSLHFVSANPEHEVRDVILHEIAHAIAGHAEGHGPKWKAVCLNIGANPERLNHTAQMPKGKYVATCQLCQTTYYRHQKMKPGYRYFCQKCGNQAPELRFERKF